MVTQAEKDAMAREFWPSDVKIALKAYREARAYYLSDSFGFPFYGHYREIALKYRRAYWNARKAAGLDAGA